MSGSISSIFSVSFQLIKHPRINHQFSHLAISEHLRSWCLHVFITGEECYMSGHAACAVGQPVDPGEGSDNWVLLSSGQHPGWHSLSCRFLRSFLFLFLTFFGHPIALNNHFEVERNSTDIIIFLAVEIGQMHH